MRLSSNLRRYRWVVFACWLLALVPSLYLALTQSDHLTGGGFEVAGSQSLHVQYQLEDHFPEQGASPLALVAAPRADASYDDMNEAVAQLEQASPAGAQRHGGAQPAQPPPAAGPAVRGLAAAGLQQHRRGRRRTQAAAEGRRRRATSRARPTTAGSSSTSSGRARSARPPRPAPSTTSPQAEQLEPADRPDRPARGVRFAGGRGDPAGARRLHRRGDHGRGLPAVDGHHACRCS